MRERRRITVQGIVQGVGFRPFVYGLAQRHSLVGQVWNDSAGVTIEAEGEREALDACLRALREESPPLAAIERMDWTPLPLNGDTAFVIESSHGQAEKHAFVSPDVCICDDCLRELFDVRDRRYGYAFINCTNCGPRFTIIRDVPYDRPLTTMAAFQMCRECRREYENPTSRRFHAQPNACPRCGPLVGLKMGLRMEAGEDALQIAARLLENGNILAVKGLGGYHLACDATSTEAVAGLRARKHRWDKPFALMAADVETVRALCEMNKQEEALLTSRRRPIVLLRARTPQRLAPEVAPKQKYLGVMLPYTPLHYLLFEAYKRGLGDGRPPIWVMTSGNSSDEPIAYRDDEARQRLAPLADYVLAHDREIHMRCDDSVTRVVCGVEVPIRRSRGYAPQPLSMSFEFTRPVLAVGAHLKNTFCLGKGRHAFVSHHIGDLDNLETLTSFGEGVEHFKRLFDIQPEVVAHDLHPDYLSTGYALKLENVQRTPVQHHHAHIASVLAEHGLTGPVIGAAFDGSGYGTDGTVWGGEFLIADLVDFERVLHLAEIPLPGGEQAIHQPWRIAAAWLQKLYGDEWLDWPIEFSRHVDRKAWAVLRQMMEHSVNSPLTSSVGRLFDAVAALLSLRDTVNYEGQAAVELEALADEAVPDGYAFTLRGSVADPAPLFSQLLSDLRAGVALSVIAARFHNALVTLVTQVCLRLRAEHNINMVALSGGVFQNAFLLARTLEQLEALGFETYTNQRVPPNDGGLALGQAAIANARLAKE